MIWLIIGTNRNIRILDTSIFVQVCIVCCFYDNFVEDQEKSRDMGGVHLDDSMISFNNLFNSIVQKKTT